MVVTPGEEADVLAKLNQGYLSEQTSGTASAASVDFAGQQNVDWYVPRNRSCRCLSIRDG